MLDYSAYVYAANNLENIIDPGGMWVVCSDAWIWSVAGETSASLEVVKGKNEKRQQVDEKVPLPPIGANFCLLFVPIRNYPLSTKV